MEGEWGLGEYKGAAGGNGAPDQRLLCCLAATRSLLFIMMHKTLVVLLAALATARGFCPSGFEAVGSQCYYFSVEFGDKKTWQRAREDCHLLDADLAVLDMNCSDNHHLLSYIINKGWTSQNMWVGASDSAQEGFWTWLDGRPMDMTSNLWRADEPTMGSTSDCAYLGYYNNDYPRIHLYDYQCGNSLYYICHYGIHPIV